MGGVSVVIGGANDTIGCLEWEGLAVWWWGGSWLRVRNEGIQSDK